MQGQEKNRAQPRKHILVVDDEAFVREAGSAMIGMLGYDCVAVDGGAAAQQYVRDHQRQIDLVLIDLNMPEMDGAACFHALRTINPDLRAVIISGSLHDDSRIRELMAEGLSGMIQKPFTMDVLEKSLASLLSD